MSYVWQRFIHFVIAVLFLTFGIGLTVFVYSNTTSVNIDWWQFHLTNVPLGMVALVPLLVGVVLGYLYHVPSGLHDFTQSMKKGRRINELEHENKDLQHKLDRLLALPDDSAPARAPVAAAVAMPMAPVTAPAAHAPAAHVTATHAPATHAPVTHAPAAHAPAAPEPRPVAKTRAVHEGKHEPAPAHDAKGRGHGSEHPTHRETAPSA
jgi:uncharacterized integral membrane protein